MLQLIAQEQVAIDSAESCQYLEASVKAIASQMLSPVDDPLWSIRIGLRDVASETAIKIQHLSQQIVKQALEIGQQLWRMQRDLKRKEYGIFLRVLGWSTTKARKYINLAKTFDGFQLSGLIKIELTTLLSLCSKRYQEVVAQLLETEDISQQLVEQLIKQNRSPRKPKQDPISCWKRNLVGGGRRYEVILHNEDTGVSIEQQALSEGILPQKVIEEAIALRAQHNEKQRKSDYVTVERDELQMVVTQARTLGGENRKLEYQLQQRERRIAELEAQLTERVAVVEDEVASESSDRNSDLLDHFAANEPEQVQASAPFHPTGHQSGARAATECEEAKESSYQHPVAENSSLPKDDVSDWASRSARGNRNVEQSDRHIEQEESANPCATQAVSTGVLDAGSDDNSSSHQLAQVAQNVLSAIRTLREFEAQVKTIDSQIQSLLKQLSIGNKTKQQEWELKDTLVNRQKLRATKIANMLTLADSNGLRVIGNELSTSGRIVLERDLAASLLENARTWSEVELIVGNSSHQLTGAVKDWQLEQRQILVRLLSAYLETEPSAFENIAWIPKKLLDKALSTLSFKLRRIGGSDNLMDEPKIEYETCSFVSLEHPGTQREQWIFNSSDNKLYPIFGREEFEIERF